MLPHESYRFICRNPHCRHLSAVDGECCCRPCFEAWHHVRPHAISPHGPGGHAQPCAHAQQVRLGAISYVQLGDEVRCKHCDGWHTVELSRDTGITRCGTIVLDVGPIGAPYLAILERRRRGI